MKYIIFLICCLLLFSACNSSTEQTMLENNTVETTYYFYLDAGVLYKYNLLTGDTSTVCTDPVCPHDNECFFAEVNYVCSHENTIFFSRSDTRTLTVENGMNYITESICSFDYASGKSSELCKIKSGTDSALQGMLEFYDGYIYFYRQTPDPEVTEFSLYRVLATGGNPEDMGLSVPMWHGAHYNDRLFFFDNVNTLYSTDIYGENKSNEVVLQAPGRIVLSRDTTNGCLYYSILYSNSNEIWKIDLTSGKTEKLYETSTGIISSLYKTDDALYFLIAGEEIQYGQTSDGRILRDPYAGKIYMIDLKSKKCETIYDNPDTHISYLRKSGNNIIVFITESEADTVKNNRFILNT